MHQATRRFQTFDRLVREWESAAIGHACVCTGTPRRTRRLAGNGWRERARGELLECLANVTHIDIIILTARQTNTHTDGSASNTLGFIM